MFLLVSEHKARAKKQEQLFEAVDAMAPEARMLLALLALTYHPIESSIQAATIAKVLVEGEFGDLAATDIEALLAAWQKKEILVSPTQDELLACAPPTENPGVIVNPLIRDWCLREVYQSDQIESLGECVNEFVPAIESQTGADAFLFADFIRRVRQLIYHDEILKARGLFLAEKDWLAQYPVLSLSAIIALILVHPLSFEWVDELFAEDYELAVAAVGLYNQRHLLPTDYLISLIQVEIWEMKNKNITFRHIWLTNCVLYGDLDQLQSVISNVLNKSKIKSLYSGCYHALKGAYVTARQEFDRALKLYRKDQENNRTFLPDLPGLYFLFCLLNSDRLTLLEQVGVYCRAGKKYHPHQALRYELIEKVAAWRMGDLKMVDELQTLADVSPQDDWVLIWLKGWIHVWLPLTPSVNLLTALENLMAIADEGNFAGIQYDCQEILLTLRDSSEKRDREWQKQLESWRNITNSEGWGRLMAQPLAWQESLTALTALVNPSLAGSTTGEITYRDKRMSWWITYYTPNNFRIYPKEQSQKKNGEWSKGRVVALHHLVDPDPTRFFYLTPQDQQICRHIISTYNYGYYSYNATPEMDDAAIIDLVGHPLVFVDEGEDIPIELISAEPQLLVEQKGAGHIRLKLHPQYDSSNVVLIKDTPTRFRVVEFNRQHRRIAEILDNKGLEVPIIAKEQALAAINSIAQLVTVHSDVDGTFTDLPSVPAVTTPHFQLLPTGEGLKVNIFVRPFGSTGPYCHPGRGQKI